MNLPPGIETCWFDLPKYYFSSLRINWGITIIIHCNKKDEALHWLSQSFIK